MVLRHFTKSQLETPEERLNVTVNMYSSNIIFNQPSIHHIGLKTGDRIVFTRDTETGEWFFFSTKDPDSFPLRRYAGSNMLAFNCKNLCKEIINQTEKDAYKVTLEINRAPVPYNGMDLYKMKVKEVELDEFFDILPQNNIGEAKEDTSVKSELNTTDTAPVPAAY